jgi:hypothetical protein
VVLIDDSGHGGPPAALHPVFAFEPPPAPGPPAKLPPQGEEFGASVNRLFNDRAYPLSVVGARLRELRATGATIARSDALWEAAEPSPPAGGVHHYDWSFDDVVAASLATKGLRWLPILDYTAGWDQSIPGQDHSPPRSTGDFAAFAGAFASRYGSGGAFWRANPSIPAEPVDTYEVWNEPDNRAFWVPAPNPSEYADLYLRTRDAIAMADPSARVVIGGLTNPGAFLPAMLRASPDLKGHIDGVAIHPYGASPLVVVARVRGARRTLKSLGLGNVPLYVTEVGWTTEPRGAQSWAPARARPGYVSATLAALGHTDCAVAATVLYTWVTPERDPANLDDWFGIEPPSGGATRDTKAFVAGLHRASAPGPVLRLCGS